MQHSKLIRLFKLLTPQELHKMSRFMQMPFFAIRQEGIELFDYIMKYAPDYEHSDLKRQTVANSLFNHRKRKENALNHAASELFKAIERIIAHLALEQDDISVKINLLQFYESRTNGVLLEKAADALRKQNEKSTTYGDRYYYNIFLMNDLSVRLYSNNNYMRMKTINQSMVALDICYAIAKLHHFLIASSTKIVKREFIDTREIDEFLGYLEKKETILQNETVQLYYHSVLLNLRRNSAYHYATLKSLLHKHVRLLTPDVIRSMYVNAEGYCIEKMEEDPTYYRLEALSLYEARLEHQLLYINGFISNITFKNIITICVFLRLYEKAENFIRDYEHKLQSEFRQSNVAYMRGLIAFSQRKYQLAIDYVSPIPSYANIDFRFEARILLIKAYYELRYYDKMRGDEILESATAALLRLIQESESLPKQTSTLYKNFAMIMKRLLRLVVKQKFEPINPTRIAAIRKAINERQTWQKKWLLEKLAQLEDSQSTK
jgi:hypothetical protein